MLFRRALEACQERRDQIIPFPTGRVSDGAFSRHFMPGYHHVVPSGQSVFHGPAFCPVNMFCS
jgi:hypothetical protein